MSTQRTNDLAFGKLYELTFEQVLDLCEVYFRRGSSTPDQRAKGVYQRLCEMQRLPHQGSDVVEIE